jgi:hypothetical protein
MRQRRSIAAAGQADLGTAESLRADVAAAFDRIGMKP